MYFIVGELADKVTSLEVEAVQFVAGSFGIYNILKYNKCGSFGVVADTLTDLTMEISVLRS
jgi:hypothetical protein